MIYEAEFDIENAEDRKCRIAEQEKRRKERGAREALENAAPDLLAACKKQLDFIERFGDDRHIDEERCAHCLLIKQAKTAIAKAEPKTG